jgi:hypothetical protein
MTPICSSCQSPKAHLVCGVCQSRICKPCAEIVHDETTALLSIVPEYLNHGVFCQSCFNDKILPELAQYKVVLERAKVMDVFYKTQAKESNFIRRIEKPIEVSGCIDRELTILKLAFLSAQAGFNVLVDVEVGYEKTRNGGWQSSVWHGKGIPAQIDLELLKRKTLASPN